MRLGILSVLTALYFSAVCVVATTCTPDSQPNPYADISTGSYTTGTKNGTLAVLLITLEEAQKVVGDMYTINRAAYRELIPAMPKDAYPLFLRAGIEHDIRLPNKVKLSDLTRVSIEYPFLSLPISRPYTFFRMVPTQLITASNEDEIGRTTSYGTEVIPATFDPPCNAYTYTRDGNAKDRKVFLQGFKKDDTSIQFDSKWETITSPDGKMPWTLDFFVNITNQPSLSGQGVDCRSQKTNFTTDISNGQWKPVVVKGSVDVAGDLYNGGDGKKWDDVWGYQVDTAFAEVNHWKCWGL
ncbi:Isoflavone reductase family protein [Lasiodiplodia theobromae]|uniref:Isoflavone reductase family protein n=1 Tax=Lasiodiplodia theobromae TaxID=45133 RepID=UPI0015C2E18B|nr:Isoflavone reductase family protein [Lasiodiplodia theobromae]KAF4544451.1 Isoflavone reductase family protein [Lasiodiplodia theobromae]